MALPVIWAVSFTYVHYFLQHLVHLQLYKAVADLRGREGRPPAQKFFIFMQFSGKIGQIIGWHPPLGLAPPSLGNPGSATAKDNFLTRRDFVIYV